jgi:hypothetical protein
MKPQHIGVTTGILVEPIYMCLGSKKRCTSFLVALFFAAGEARRLAANA